MSPERHRNIRRESGVTGSTGTYGDIQVPFEPAKTMGKFECHLNATETYSENQGSPEAPEPMAIFKCHLNLRKLWGYSNVT